MARLIWLEPLLRVALPPRCAGCGAVVGDDGQLCAACWQSVTFLTGEGCVRCGLPMADAGMTCGPCLAEPPAYETARAAVLYDGIAREIVLKFKHGRRIAMARLMAQAMLRHLPHERHLLVPVPLHRWRLWRRGFNQSLELARVLSANTGWPIAAQALLRQRPTPMLAGLGRKERARVLRGAFLVNPAMRSDVRGQRILLIDDVHTSGATANACAQTLRRAGVASVQLLTWARVPPADWEGN